MILREATKRDIPEIARVHVDTSQTTYRGIFPDEIIENLSYEKREQGWHQVFNQAQKDNNFTYVVEDEYSQIIGFANAGKERSGDLIYRGELNAIYILKSHQQQDLGVLTPWSKFLQQKRQIKEILQAECDRRRNNPDAMGEDILSLLLAGKYEDGQPMSDESIRDELMTMLFAGHETTASSLAWSFYWLHRLPEVGQKCKSELNSLSETAEFTEITKLPYLSAVVSETLRLNPVVVSVGRRLKQPFELMGYQLESGTSLLPSIYLTHQREELYPEPQKFKPERFLERQFSPYEYLPFGGGNRRCLGYAFALFEMKLVLATIMSRVELELLDDRPLKSGRRGFTFTPEGGVRMKVVSLKTGG